MLHNDIKVESKINPIILSGSVGFTLLKSKNNIENKDIYVLLLADIHDGVTYCKTNSTMIAELLNSKSTKNSILLEEIFTPKEDKNKEEKVKLKALWPNSKHTNELQILNNTNDRITPIDIRPYLIPFSWELVNNSDSKLGKMELKKYIEPLENFFNKSLKFYNENIKDKVDMMNTIQSYNTGSKLSPSIHFEEIHKLFDDFKKEFEENMNNSIFILTTTNIIPLERINNLISLIMEWYTILLIHNNIKNIIIHCGLAHNQRLLDLLTKVYRFNIIQQKGINKMTDLPHDIPSACILLPSNVIGMFNNKYGYY